MTTKYTLKQKHDWFKRSLEHLEECVHPECEWYWRFKKFLEEK